MIQTFGQEVLFYTLMVLSAVVGYSFAYTNHERKKKALAKMIGVRPIYLERLIEMADKQHGKEV